MKLQEAVDVINEKGLIDYITSGQGTRNAKSWSKRTIKKIELVLQQARASVLISRKGEDFLENIVNRMVKQAVLVEAVKIDDKNNHLSKMSVKELEKNADMWDSAIKLSVIPVAINIVFREFEDHVTGYFDYRNFKNPFKRNK